MELWEFNLYIIGKSNAYKQKIKEMITGAYYTASFNNTEKPKSLSYYLDIVDKQETSKEEQKNKISFAVKMSEKIERSKNGT